MALSLQAIRDYVRTHIDLDIEDLPDALLDVFVREGSKRVEKANPRWPFYEATWTFPTVAAQRDYPLSTVSTEINSIASVSADDRQLLWVGRDVYQELNPLNSTSSGKPKWYTWWADTLSLYPTPDAAYSLTMRGYRKPLDWVADGAGGIPDLPDELHNTVATWALSKSYNQQEDPELGGIYEGQFWRELDEFQKRIVQTPHPQPLVLNAQSSFAFAAPFPPRFDWQQ